MFKDKPWNIVMLCAGCKKESRAIAASLGLCAECLSSGESVFDGHAGLVHRRVRARFALPTTIPRGLRRSVGGKLKGGNARDGYVHWYTDPLPTNCVADWVCPAGTGAGYPLFANNDGPEIGFLNLAVFYLGCTFDCLFCQNWQCRKVTGERTKTAEELAAAVEDAVSCICYFGGEPSPQIHHALAAARRARRARGDGILRICWESNGSMSPALLGPMIDISLESGGCIKFDIKAFNAELHRALTGAGNDRTLSNVDLIAGHLERRPEPPLFIASTLLVPGYVDEEEVSRIADFLAQRSPDIPYTLLAFSPQFEMRDLPPTSREQAERCYIAAIQAGLNRVRIGNMHLLLS